MQSVVEVSENPYSRLVSWEVWNFMSIEHGKCEFDERNIINLKGYNDSGKSAMLSALKVLMFNSNATKQVGFIQDDKEFFRILATFDDGIQILRDKYINGQSLYEMYKDGQCIFSTKSGNALTKVSDVPKPIEDYLGLISYDGSCLNARACFEKQIGVQTTGSENYKMFNTVLKSEEIAVASELLNNDKNKLASDINATDNELQAQKSVLGVGKYLTEGIISYLKEHDFGIDTASEMESSLVGITRCYQAIDMLPVIPAVPNIDTVQLDLLSRIKSIAYSFDSIPVIPEVPVVDNNRMESLVRINSILNSLSSITVYPEVSFVDNEQLQMLQTIQGVVDSISECDESLTIIDSKLSDIQSELVKLQMESQEHGIKMVKCPGCGAIFNPETEHVH